MYTKSAINELYRRYAIAIDISDEMFEKAVGEYNALGKWIDQETPDYKISIYPQGSFALRTVVRPISDEDDYDLDLVCEFAQSYGLSARQLKVDVVKPLLVDYKRINGEILNKRRCWHVEYEDVPNFHMDVVPAYANGSSIRITDHDEEIDFYQYMGSNPAGYVKWFFDRCKKQHQLMYETYVRDHSLVIQQADVEEVKRQKVKTPLQRAIQLLKRHRDIMFQDRDEKEKPISIIITTVAAQLYQEEDNVYDALMNILENAPQYIRNNMRDGLFFIENPSFAGENFADKWNEHPERAQAFFEWLRQAQLDFVDDRILDFNRIEMAAHTKRVLGESIGTKVFAEMAKEDRAGLKDNTLKVSAATGAISAKGTVSVPPNHHYGA